MTDRERVAYDIERCISHVPDACRDCSHDWSKKDGDVTAIDCMEKLMADALALLKEQELTRPVFNGRFWECEECGQRYKDILVVKGYKFCPWCGRRIEWERDV